MLKIINQTDSKILIASKIPFRDRLSNSIFLLLFGLPNFLVPMFFAFDYVSKTGVVKIECDRVEPQQVDCQISKSNFFDLAKSKPLDYKFVQLSEYEDVDTNFTVNEKPVFRTRFLLTTKFGKKEVFEDINKLTASYISYSLNSFLDSNQKSLSYNYDERFNYPVLKLSFPTMVIFLLVGSPFIWFGLLVLISYEEVFLDKPNSLLKHTKRTLLGTKKINRYLFNEVAKVDVLYTTDSYSNVSFTPRITINSKLQFKLDTIGDRQAAIKVANDLNRFMGLPEEEDPVVKQ